MLSLAAPPNARALSSIALGVASAATLAAPGHAVQLQQDFAGVYAPANWTFVGNGGDGSVDTAGAPGSITLTGSNQNPDDEPGPSISTDYTTTAFASGPVSFDWSYSSDDEDFYDSFLFFNGSFTFSFTLIADNASQGSGFSQFNVLVGDTFGFRVFTFDDQYGPGIATISNFSAPVPGPLPLLGVGAAFGYSRRLRRRTTLANGPVSSASASSTQL